VSEISDKYCLRGGLVFSIFHGKANLKNTRATLIRTDFMADTRAQIRILIVDDQPMVADSLKLILKLDGYEVHTAKNGSEALALFEPKKFDLIFMDFEMPGMKGDELAAAIRARDPRQPIILITAYCDLALHMEPAPQVDLVIGKPWSVGELRTAVSKVLSPG
jgi:two-component system response regulator AtoC